MANTFSELQRRSWSAHSTADGWALDGLGYDFTVRARHDGLEDTRDSAGLSALVVICSGASTLTRMRGSARRRVVVRGGATQRGDVNLAATRCLRMGLCVAPSKYALQGM